MVASVGKLADLAGLPEPALRFLAAGAARLYVRRERPKRGGGTRVIEAPRADLKRAQRMLLRRLLDCTPMLPCVHGCRKRRSVRSFASPHVGRAMVATLDIRDFFPSVDRCRLLRIAEDRFGMEPETAKLFVMLTTRNHRLPQGAPTSPALANLAFAKSDRILSELATDHCLTYTRYVDDLAFSASYDFRALGPRLEAAVRASGFRPNRQKTQFMSKSEDQIVTGLRVNVDLRPTAEWLADLRDLLEHCVRDGPESWDEGRHYDFRRHLGGCVQWLRSVNRELAREYQWLFGQVRWRPEE